MASDGEIHRESLWLVSRLFAYPDAAWWEGLPGLEAAAARLPARLGAPIGRSLRRLRASEPRALEQAYVATFDFDERTTLYLTYPRFKDARERGPALVALKRAYASGGFAVASRELPDYLPLLLEFLSFAPTDAARPVAREFAPAVAELGSRLREAGSPYADGLDAARTAMNALGAPASRLGGWWTR